MNLSQVLVIFVSSVLLKYVECLCQWEADGTFVPDPSSRSHFFYCRQGTAIRGQCDNGQEFDPFHRSCEPVAQTVPPPIAGNPCRGLPDGTFLPDPASRQRFFFCNNGEALTGSCDPGHEFIPGQNVCDIASNVPAPPGDPCFGQSDGTFLPSPNSREGFIWCNGGVGTTGTCPSGQIFDPQLRYCVDSTSQTTTPAAPRDPCFGQSDGTFLPNPESRDGFIWCNGGVGTTGTCPSGQIFDPQLRYCVDSTSQTTTPAAPRDPCFGQSDGNFLPNPESREGFFWCSGGISIPGTCPEGQFFEPQLLFCDFEGTTTKIQPPLPTRAPPPVGPTRAPPLPTRAPPSINPTRAPPAVPSRAPPSINPTRAPPAIPTRAPQGFNKPTRAPSNASSRRPRPIPTRAS